MVVVAVGRSDLDATGANFADCLIWNGEIQRSSENVSLTAIIGENDTNATLTVRMAWDVTSG